MSAALTGGGRRFRPSLWATLFTVPAVLIMLGLGTWQAQRLSWKNDLIQRVQERLASPPVPLPASIADPEPFDLRPVTVGGRLLHEREMLLLARPRQGQVGYEVVTPLERADGGPAVLVNRGWVPMDRRDPATRREGQAGGEVTIRGVARQPVPAGWLQPDNVSGAPPKDYIWRRADTTAMGAAAGLPAVAPLVVEALPGQVPGGLPAGIEPRAELPNNHLQYAVTWYSLAATLLVIYVLFHLRRPRERA